MGKKEKRVLATALLSLLFVFGTGCFAAQSAGGGLAGGIMVKADPVYVVHNITSDSVYTSFYEAWNDAAATGAQLKLLADATLEAVPLVNGKNLTIDLNGYSLDLGGSDILNAGQLVITNSSTADPVVHYFAVTESGWSMVNAADLTQEQIQAAADAQTAETLTGVSFVKVSGSLLYNGKGFGAPGQTMGGAIINTAFSGSIGTLGMENIAVVGCFADNGGVVENESGASAILNHVRVYGCRAQNGALVYNNMGEDHVVIKDSEVKFCSATNFGGAILNFATLSIEHSSFTECTAPFGGCAYNGGTLMSNGGSFINCQAVGNGGAIFTDGQILNPVAKENAINTLTIMENTGIFGCTSPNHAGYNEAVYVRNSTFAVVSGYVENGIFADSDTSLGYPVCTVTIVRGEFPDFVPDASFIADGSSVLQAGEGGTCYVTDKAFSVQPAPKDETSVFGEKNPVTWNIAEEVEVYRLYTADPETGSWELVCEFTPEEESGLSYDLEQEGSDSVTLEYRLAACKGGCPMAISDPFSVTWKPAEDQSTVSENTTDSDDTGEKEGTQKETDKEKDKEKEKETGTGEGKDAGKTEEAGKPAGTQKAGFGKDLVIPKSVRRDGVTYSIISIKKNAFKDNKTLETATVGGSVREIGDFAFSGCSNLKKVTLGKKVSRLGNGVFSGCTSLSEITIPAGVTKFGADLFAGDTNLSVIRLPSKKLKASMFHKKTFRGLGDSVVIKVPKAKVKAYKKMFRKKGLSKKVKVVKL